jgi:hypothetical protein
MNKTSAMAIFEAAGEMLVLLAAMRNLTFCGQLLVRFPRATRDAFIAEIAAMEDDAWPLTPRAAKFNELIRRARELRPKPA